MQLNEDKRIGLDARMWSEKGIGRYIQGLVKGIIQAEARATFVLFCLQKDRSAISALIPAHWETVVVNVRWYSFTEQLVMPIAYYRAQVELVHIPHFNVPILYFRSFVVTIHDLTHYTFASRMSTRLPAWLANVRKMGYHIAFVTAIRRSRHVYTVSEYVAAALRKKFPRVGPKLTVTYEAADICMAISSDKTIRILNEYGVTEKYFYYIGNAHPHKNLEFLLQAFADFKRQQPSAQLVLSGDDHYFWPRLKKWATYQHLTDGVIFTGQVSDEVKDTLLKTAEAYVFPSLSEGFGLPLLESMQCGCPVISSNATALPEIADDAALYFDPSVSQELIDCMNNIYENNSLRLELVAKGYRRAQVFSWRKMASQTIASY